MTDKELLQEITEIRNKAEIRLEELREEAQEVLDECRSDVFTAMHRQGRWQCENCDGTGAIERLDSGYMRRFGLREWDGCPRCGGDGERRGWGFRGVGDVR